MKINEIINRKVALATYPMRYSVDDSIIKTYPEMDSHTFDTLGNIVDDRIYQWLIKHKIKNHTHKLRLNERQSTLLYFKGQ